MSDTPDLGTCKLKSNWLLTLHIKMQAALYFCFSDCSVPWAYSVWMKENCGRQMAHPITCQVLFVLLILKLHMLFFLSFREWLPRWFSVVNYLEHKVSAHQSLQQFTVIHSAFVSQCCTLVPAVTFYIPLLFLLLAAHSRGYHIWSSASISSYPLHPFLLHQHYPFIHSMNLLSLLFSSLLAASS